MSPTPHWFNWTGDAESTLQVSNCWVLMTPHLRSAFDYARVPAHKYSRLLESGVHSTHRSLPTSQECPTDHVLVTSKALPERVVRLPFSSMFRGTPATPPRLAAAAPYTRTPHPAESLVKPTYPYRGCPPASTQLPLSHDPHGASPTCPAAAPTPAALAPSPPGHKTNARGRGARDLLARGLPPRTRRQQTGTGCGQRGRLLHRLGYSEEPTIGDGWGAVGAGRINPWCI